MGDLSLSLSVFYFFLGTPSLLNRATGNRLWRSRVGIWQGPVTGSPSYLRTIERPTFGLERQRMLGMQKGSTPVATIVKRVSVFLKTGTTHNGGMNKRQNNDIQRQSQGWLKWNIPSIDARSLLLLNNSCLLLVVVLLTRNHLSSKRGVAVRLCNHSPPSTRVSISTVHCYIFFSCHIHQ